MGLNNKYKLIKSTTVANGILEISLFQVSYLFVVENKLQRYRNYFNNVKLLNRYDTTLNVFQKIELQFLLLYIKVSSYLYCFLFSK